MCALWSQQHIHNPSLYCRVFCFFLIPYCDWLLFVMFGICFVQHHNYHNPFLNINRMLQQTFNRIRYNTIYRSNTNPIPSESAAYKLSLVHTQLCGSLFVAASRPNNNAHFCSYIVCGNKLFAQHTNVECNLITHSIRSCISLWSNSPSALRVYENTRAALFSRLSLVISTMRCIHYVYIFFFFIVVGLPAANPTATEKWVLALVLCVCVCVCESSDSFISLIMCVRRSSVYFAAWCSSDCWQLIVCNAFGKFVSALAWNEKNIILVSVVYCFFGICAPTKLCTSYFPVVHNVDYRIAINLFRNSHGLKLEHFRFFTNDNDVCEHTIRLEYFVWPQNNKVMASVCCDGQHPQHLRCSEFPYENDYRFYGLMTVWYASSHREVVHLHSRARNFAACHERDALSNMTDAYWST